MHQVGDGAMHEHLARIKTADFGGRDPAVGTADPQVVRVLLMRQPVEEPRIGAQFVCRPDAVGVEQRFEIGCHDDASRSEEHTSELQSLMRISYAVFCLKKKKTKETKDIYNHNKCKHNHDISHE